MPIRARLQRRCRLRSEHARFDNRTLQGIIRPRHPNIGMFTRK